MISHILLRLKASVSPQIFTRLVLVVSAIWLLVLYPVIHGFYKNHLPQRMVMGGCDFWQYYTGALVVRHDCWDCLYPKPKAEIYEKAPEFKPLVNTFLFNASNPDSRRGHWAFYRQICFPESSDVAPKLLELCPELKSNFHYMYPPPTSLLVAPLGFFDSSTAFQVWFFVLCFSLFGISFFASNITRLIWGEASYAVGWVALLPVIPTWLGSNMTIGLVYGNVTPLLGCLISGGVYAWLRNSQISTAFSIIPLVLFKGVAISWCPLLLIKPVKWKCMAALAVLTVLLNGIVLYCGGTGVYRVFFVDILPKASIPIGMGLQGGLLLFFGVSAPWAFTLLNLLLLALLYVGFWRARRALPPQQHAVLLVATLAGTIAVFCLCNAVVFPHYISTYLLYPFAGWILWEKSQSAGIWRKLIWFVLLLMVVAWFDAILFLRNSVLFEWLHRSGNYRLWMDTARSICNAVPAYLLPLAVPAILLAFAYRRLFSLHMSLNSMTKDGLPLSGGCEVR